MTKLSISQIQEREQIIFSCPYSERSYSMGGIRHFENLSIDKARELMEKGYIDPNETQDLSLTAEEMLEFCGSDPKWYVHGYAVSPDRDDCRVTLEGVGSTEPLSAEEAVEFAKLFRYASELQFGVGECAWCWYD